MDHCKNSMHAKDIKLSKSLSWLLRHGAEKEGLSFDNGGFIDVKIILELRQFKNYCLDDVIRVVNENDKQRFTLRHKDDHQHSLQIRANQGHSLKVDEEGLLTPLLDNAIPIVYHGTYFSKLNSIKITGLSRMKRNHIHFTSKFPGEGEVISGMRKNCEICIVVDSLKATEDGFKFYISDNGVILCGGNPSGIIPPSYFKEIWQLKPLKKIC